MIYHVDLSKSEVLRMIRNQTIMVGGNSRLKIYGLLSCDTGKRMKKANRVFFATTDEAVSNGYRPCGHCMREAYSQWKQRKNRVEWGTVHTDL